MIREDNLMKHSQLKIYSFLILALLIAVVLFTYSYFRFGPRRISNVVLISIDTCRADHLSCYGFERETTPNIDRIAGEGFLFANAISPVPLTLPGHSSMLTGTIPPYHGVHDNTYYKLNESNVTLAELLKPNGFKTAAFVSAFVLDSRFGLDQGFDSYNDEFKDRTLTSNVAERRGGETSRAAVEWLNKNNNERFFMFLHYFDPHKEYDAPEPFGTRFMLEPYSGEVAYTDHCIGQVIDKLKELGLYNSTLIIITSDHGESLGEHGELTHGYFIYQSTIKVPLIFRIPGRSKGVRVGTNVSLVDITPTVCKLLGVSIPLEIQGRDLSGYFSKGNSEEERPLYSEALMPTEYDCNPLTGIVNGDFKYIQTTRPELYNLKSDPKETENLAGKQPQRARIMQEDLKQIMETQLRSERSSERAYLDAESRARLESLGYVTTVEIDDSFEFDQSKDDPKDLINFHLLDSSISLCFKMNMYDEAKKMCNRIMELKPGLPKTYYYLGTALSRTGDHEAAVKYLSRYIEFEPDRCEGYNNLGMSLIGLERFSEAKEMFIKAIEIYPDHDRAHFNLGRVLNQEGKYDEAISHFRRAQQLSPNERSIQIGLNMAMRGQKTASIITQDLADEKKAEALDALAAEYAAAGEFYGAIETLQKAIKIAISSGREDIVRKLRARLELYRNDRSFSEPSRPEINVIQKP